MNKYNKPKIKIIEILSPIITTPSTGNGLNDVGGNESWNSGIVEEFDFGG